MTLRQVHPLSPGEVHVWYCPDGDQATEALVEQGSSWLSPEERAANLRYSHPASRRHHLLARVLVRAALSRYAAVRPSDWRFVSNAHGRPEIDPSFSSPLHFNVSHSGRLLACAVSTHAEVGIDVEDASRAVRMLELGERCFSPSEFEELKALADPALQRERFFQYWTLKEAYIKARGMGLSLPLERFAFRLDRGGDAISVSFDIGFDDRPEDWRFGVSVPFPGYQAAFAVRSASPVKWIERSFTFG